MKTSRLLFLVILSSVLSFSAFAQNKALPAGITEKSSPEEIFKWLDETNLSQARIGIEENASGPEQGEIPIASTRYYEQAFFSKGFRLKKVEGCRVTLKTDNAEIIRFESKYPNPTEGSLDDFRKNRNKQSQFTGELFIPLRKLKANKSPFRHTKKTAVSVLLGTWRTEFKEKSDFFLIPSEETLKSLLENQIKLEISGIGEDERKDSMSGDEITFTFDDRQMSEDFYAAFSRAISLCDGSDKINWR